MAVFNCVYKFGTGIYHFTMFYFKGFRTAVLFALPLGLRFFFCIVVHIILFLVTNCFSVLEFHCVAVIRLTNEVIFFQHVINKITIFYFQFDIFFLNITTTNVLYTFQKCYNIYFFYKAY